MENKNDSKSAIKVPSDETYPIVNLLFQNKLLKSNELNTNSLTLSCLDLIDIGRINIEFNDEIESINIKKNPIFKGKGQMEKELKIMENIKFTINSKSMKKLSKRDQIILNMFKDINKNYEFDLKSMYEKMFKKEIAINFAKYFNDYVKSTQRESKYSEESYKDIIENGLFTFKGNELSNEWKEFKNDLKSNESFYNKENENLFDKYLIYGRTFEIEENVIKNIKKAEPDYDSDLFKFLNYNGAELLKLIFDKGLSNSKIERKGDGSVPLGNSKYFVPGFW